jgi:hypothetical protein
VKFDLRAEDSNGAWWNVGSGSGIRCPCPTDGIDGIDGIDGGGGGG